MSEIVSDHACDKGIILGSLKTEIGNLKSGLEQADEILEQLRAQFNKHEVAATSEVGEMKQQIALLSIILKAQTERVTELMKVTAENTQWLQANGALVGTVEDHEKRVTDLEHNRTFAKGVLYVIGLAVTFFGIAPSLKRLISWIFGIDTE